jgi:predicted metal-dependent hydrolase
MTGAVLHLDGMAVPVQTAGPSRKARLTIERDGSLTLRAAEDIDSAELQAFLTAKRGWIYKKLAEKEALRYEPVTEELVDGEGFLLLGRSYRLLIVSTDDGHVSLQRGRLIMRAALVRDGHGALIRWYRSRGNAWLKPRVLDWHSGCE